MMVFIDSEYRCHVSNDGTMRGYEISGFDGKCPEFVEGHRFVPEGEIWTRSDGEKFTAMLSPWKDSVELDRAQAEYEHDLLEQLKAELADADAALAILGVTVDE